MHGRTDRGQAESFRRDAFDDFADNFASARFVLGQDEESALHFRAIEAGVDLIFLERGRYHFAQFWLVTGPDFDGSVFGIPVIRVPSKAGNSRVLLPGCLFRKRSIGRLKR